MVSSKRYDDPDDYDDDRRGGRSKGKEGGKLEIRMKDKSVSWLW